METLISKLKEIYNDSKGSACTKFDIQERLNSLIEDYSPIPLTNKRKVVVKKDGTQFLCENGISWEYEADDDYLTTVAI